jgi:hypothetical protein
MVLLRLVGFNGENRALHPSLLPDTVGTSSINQKPGYGDLRPWKAPADVGVSVASGTKTIYRMNRTVPSDTQYWLRWPTVVHAVVGPNSGDTNERTYYTGSGTPKWTDMAKAIAGASYPNSYRELGVPAPTSACLLSSTSTASADIGKHTYKVEESAISSMAVGDIYRITVGTAAAETITLADSGNGHITVASLRTQIDALTGVSATAVVASGSLTAGVQILSDVVGVSFIIEKKTGTDSTPNYDSAVVSYTTLQDLAGSAGNPATYTIAESWITDTNAAVGSRWAVTVNSLPPVSITLTAGASTYPARVNSTSLADALSLVPGITATLGNAANAVDKEIVVATIATGTVAHITVQRIVPVTSGTPLYGAAGSSYALTDSRSTETRYYVYTFVTDAGEEGPPSPPSAAITVKVGDTVNITSLGPVPSGAYGITRIRVYRTQTGSTSTEFYFLAEIVSTGTTATDSGQTIGEVLPTATWLPPPADLSHLTAMWNGMMAGITGKSVRVCEAYVPYAWPVAYEILPSDTTPVALATFGQNLVIATNGKPILVTGGSPDALDEQPLEFLQSCVSDLSMVGMGTGVAWAAPDGLAWVGAGGARILTANMMTRVEWQALKPETIQGSMFEGRYFGRYTVSGVTKMFMLDPANANGMYFLDFGVDGIYVDALQDAMYVLSGTAIQKWDSGSALTVTFKSKLYVMPYPVQGFGCAQVRADAYPTSFKFYASGMDPAEVTALVANDSRIVAVGTTGISYTQTVASNEPFRLPGGYKAREFQVELSSTGAVQSCFVAHGIGELKQV